MSGTTAGRLPAVDGVAGAIRAAERGHIPDLDFGDLLAWNERERGGSLAVVIGDDAATFAELASRVRATAARLRALGLTQGDRLGLLGSNTTSWLIAALAALSMGVTAVPVNARYSEAEIDWLLGVSDLSLLLVQPRFGRKDLTAWIARSARAGQTPLQVIAGDHPDVPRFDTGPNSDPGMWPRKGTGEFTTTPGIVMFTSGSTSRPKGCVLLQGPIIRNAAQHTQRLSFGAGEGWFSPMPFYHAGGLVWGLTSILVTGGRLISQELFDAGAALRLIEEYGCVYEHGVDTMFVAQIQHEDFRRLRMKSLRVLSSSGPSSFMHRLQDAVVETRVISKWGITEGYGNLTLPSPSDDAAHRLETVGRGYDGIEYRIDSNRSDTPGEILVRGSVMDGYFRDVEATRAVIDSDGWLHTGDLGLIAGDRYLRFAGRVKQMLKVGGENVSALEIESALLANAAVSIACVVGEVDDRLGEVPVAIVEIAAGSNVGEGELIAGCHRMLAAFKVPARVHLVGPGEMPLTGSGKPDRRAVAELADARSLQW